MDDEREPGRGFDADAVERAVRAVRDGGLVVYPTETAYGLGADALDPDAVRRVFEAKGRDRSKPVSMAVPTLEVAREYTSLTAREESFAEAFLPGPVTLVVSRREVVPDALTAGRDRVGVRIPDHAGALALLRRTGPLTATSANVSGTGSVRHPVDLDERIRDGAVVLDGGETPGGGSTVVDVERSVLHRRGELADEIESWLGTE